MTNEQLGPTGNEHILQDAEISCAGKVSWGGKCRTLPSASNPGPAQPGTSEKIPCRDSATPCTVPPWALLSLRSLLQAVITAQTHEFHEHSAPQGFSGSDFIWSETFKQDLAVFVYFFLCFLSYMELQSADDSLC